MANLTDEQAMVAIAVLRALADCAAWSSVEAHMKDGGIDDPAAAIEDLENAL